MDSSLQRRFSAAAAIAVIALVLAACGDGEPVAEGSPPADAPHVSVSATEYAYEVSSKTLEPGVVVFDLTNNGSMEHDLVLEGGPGGGTQIIGPGETDSFFVTLEPGTYTLYCSVGNHRAQGMEFTITVM